VPLLVKISKPWVLVPAVPDCPPPEVPPPEGAATVVIVQVLSTPPTSVVTVELVLYVEGALLLTCKNCPLFIFTGLVVKDELEGIVALALTAI